MRDFDLIPFDEGTDVLAAPSIVAALEPRKKKTKRRSSSRKVTVAEPQPVLQTEKLVAVKPQVEKKERSGFSALWLFLGVIAAYLIAQLI